MSDADIEIDGERWDRGFPRPRTLAQEVEVQRRHCRPCPCGNELVVIVDRRLRLDFLPDTDFNVDRWRVECAACKTYLLLLAHSPAAARGLWNRHIAAKPPKLATRYDALKERLKKANQEKDRALALARRWEEERGKAYDAAMKNAKDRDFYEDKLCEASTHATSSPPS